MSPCIWCNCEFKWNPFHAVETDEGLIVVCSTDCFAGWSEHALVASAFAIGMFQGGFEELGGQADLQALREYRAGQRRRWNT